MFNFFRGRPKLPFGIGAGAPGVPQAGAVSAPGVMGAGVPVDPASMQGMGAYEPGAAFAGLIKKGMGVGAPADSLAKPDVMPRVPGTDQGAPIDVGALQNLSGAIGAPGAMGAGVPALGTADALQAKSAQRQALLHRMHLMQA